MINYYYLVHVAQKTIVQNRMKILNPGAVVSVDLAMNWFQLFKFLCCIFRVDYLKYVLWCDLVTCIPGEGQYLIELYMLR